MKKYLIYFVAIGTDCISQLRLCLESFKAIGNFDILIISDYSTRFSHDLPKGVGDIFYRNISSSELKRNDIYSFRTQVDNIFDIDLYDGVIYMDCDFLFIGNLDLNFFEEAIYLSREPHMKIDNKFFNRDLSESEISINKGSKAINSGFIFVSKKEFSFFRDWRYKTISYKHREELDHCPEQTVLNSMFFKNQNRFKIIPEDLIFFPIWKKDSFITENTKLIHLAGIVKNKVYWMNQIYNEHTT